MVKNAVIVLVMSEQVKVVVGDGKRQIAGMLPAKIASKRKRKKESRSDAREPKLPFFI